MGFLSKRTQNEKNFHDLRFEDGVGYRTQVKFYKTVKSAYDLFDSIVKVFANGGGTGLEYGCSTGEYIKELNAKYDFEATGIDISSNGIEIASRNLSGLTKNPKFLVMNANEPDFNNNQFDFCFGKGILHHLDWPQSIEQLNRILKADGRFVFIEPLGTNPIINMYRKFTPTDRSPDELPLTYDNIQFLKLNFPFLSLRYFGFLSILLFILNEKSYLLSKLLNLSEKLDSFIFRIPGFWRLAWVVVIEGKK